MRILFNKKAFHEYQIAQEFVAGIVLTGNEVKSIRMHNASIGDSYAILINNEIWIKNMIIARYKQSPIWQKHDDSRDKKLLLNRQEINKIKKSLQVRGNTIIPIEILTIHNRIKIKIAVAHGKKQYDHRETIKRKDIERDIKNSL